MLIIIHSYPDFSFILYSDLCMYMFEFFRRGPTLSEYIDLSIVSKESQMLIMYVHMYVCTSQYLFYSLFLYICSL